MDILIYSNVENLVLVESQTEFTRPLTFINDYTFLYSNISALKVVIKRSGKLQS